MGPKCVSNWESLLTFDLGIDLEKSKLSKTNLWGISSWQVLQFDIGLLIDKKDLHVDLQFQDLQNPIRVPLLESKVKIIQSICQNVSIVQENKNMQSHFKFNLFQDQKVTKAQFGGHFECHFLAGSSGMTTCFPAIFGFSFH